MSYVGLLSCKSSRNSLPMTGANLKACPERVDESHEHLHGVEVRTKANNDIV